MKTLPNCVKCEAIRQTLWLPPPPETWSKWSNQRLVTYSFCAYLSLDGYCKCIAYTLSLCLLRSAWSVSDPCSDWPRVITPKVSRTKTSSLIRTNLKSKRVIYLFLEKYNRSLKSDLIPYPNHKPSTKHNSNLKITSIETTCKKFPSIVLACVKINSLYFSI